MDTRPAAVAAQEVDAAAVVAESLRADFVRLVAIFDRQLGGASAARDNVAMTRARGAARRGLRLSEELVGLLRNMNMPG